VALVDDHDMVRAGFRALLEHTGGVEVVGEGADGNDALTLARELRPDLILMDVHMPRLGGIEAARQITRELPDTRIIMLSGWGGEHAEAALQAGALGYVMKGSRPAVLRAAMAAVMRGEVFSSASLDDAGQPTAPVSSATAQARAALTKRQSDVFQLLVEGKSLAQIGALLGIGEQSAATHRSEILERLGLKDDTALTDYAVKQGLLPPQPSGESGISRLRRGE
jgi:DNA-binding NarL/FixJ family response regulator